MKTIWKYDLKPDITRFEMPEHAEILTVQEQYGKPRLWAIVETGARLTTRIFITVGTGHEMPIPDPGLAFEYVATWQLEGGRLIFHTFELVRK